MEKEKLYHCIQNLAADEAFKECISSLENYKFSKQEYLELVARFLVLRYASEDELLKLRNLPTFIT
jgi:hypothetical protein